MSPGFRSAKGLFRFVSETLSVLLVAFLVVSFALAALPMGSRPDCGNVDPTLLGIECDPGFLATAVGNLQTAVTLQFGDSARGIPVSEVLFSAIMISAGLVVTSVVLLLLIGIPVGMGAALRPESLVFKLVNRTLLLVSNVPILLWAILVLALGTWMGIPIQATSIPSDRGEALIFLVAPILPLVLGDGLLADLIRRVQIDTEDFLAEPYFRTVHAMGLGVRRHLLQSLAPSVADLIVSRSLFLIGGAIVVEWVLNRPGIGFQVLQALLNWRGGREPNLVLGASLSLVGLGLALRAGSYLVGILADPRRLRSSAGRNR